MRQFGRLLLPAFAAVLSGLGLAAFWVAASATRAADARAEQHLLRQARLAVALIEARRAGAAPIAWDELADRLATELDARVTLLAEDGSVLGDSAAEDAALSEFGHHNTHPEINAARRHGVGVARRQSVILGADFLYVAIRTGLAEPTVVRLAVASRSVDESARLVWRLTLRALLVALAAAAGIAGVMAWRRSREVRRLVAAAEQCGALGQAEQCFGQGDDDLHTVARAWAAAAAAARARAETLARDHVLMATIVADMSEAVVVTDAAHRVQFANDAARRLFRLSDLAVSRPLIEAVRHPTVNELVRAASEGQRTGLVELALGGEPRRVVAARAVPLRRAAHNGALLVAHDITAIKQAELTRRDLMANVAHELRTPLTILRGYLETLADEHPGDGEAQRWVEISLRQTRRLERLVQNLLKLARLEAGQESLDLVSCSVEALFQEVAADLGLAAATKGQHLVQRIAPDMTTIVVDPAKLRDILRNLVDNAIAYSPPGSTIILEARPADEGVELRVADEGPGIPDDQRERIFERFYRLDPARSPDTGGTGLGLAIVKHLVTLHGGTVRATNRPEGGALFVVTLPDRALDLQ